MSNDGTLGRALVGPGSAGLREVLRRLPRGGPEQQAVEAGEVDAVIDYGNANVIMFPAARRALRVLENVDNLQPVAILQVFGADRLKIGNGLQ